MPESSSQEINDDNLNPLKTISQPCVDLPENENTIASPSVVSSPPTVLRRSQRIKRPVVKLNL